MKTKLAAILVATTTMTGAAYAESHGSEGTMEGDASMSDSDGMSSGSVSMEKHDAAVAAITAGNDEVKTSDDVVIGVAQRAQVDADGNVVGFIRLYEELDTEMTAIKTPLLVQTENGETELRIGVTKSEMQDALNQRQE